MKELLEQLVNEGYPLTTVAKHTGVSYGRLYRCKTLGIELRESDTVKVAAYAKKLGVK